MIKIYISKFSPTPKIESYIKEINLLNQSKDITYEDKSINLYKKTLKESLAYQAARQKLESKKNVLISKQLLQELNGLVMSGDSKMIENFQYAPIRNLKGEAIYTSSLFSARDLDNLIAWISATNIYSVEVKAAIAHCEFVRIHPFHDGNGRTARLLSTLILWQGGYSLDICYALEDYFEVNKESYYKALDFRSEDQRSESYNVKCDIASWIEYFCCFLLEVIKSISK